MVPHGRKEPKDAPTTPTSKKRRTSKPKSAPPVKSAKKSKVTPSKATKPKCPSPSRIHADSTPPDTCPGYPEPTTQAQRDRARFKISQKSLYHEISTTDDIAALAATLSQNGMSSTTWGFTSQSPIVGTTRPRKSRSLRERGMHDIQNDWDTMMAEIMPLRRQVISNDLRSSPILRVSLEVREIIYEYVMCAGVKNTVMVGSDWSRLEFLPTSLLLPSPSSLNSSGKKRTYKPSTRHNILKVCRQFAHEATAFLYAHTTWTAIVKPVASIHLQKLYDRHDMFLPSINPDLHHLFKDCVLEVKKNCWTMEHYKEITRSINTLHKARANINTFTIALYAERKSGLASTIFGGLETNHVSFSDFLSYPDDLMRAVRKLCPKVFKVVMKIAGGRKFDFIIDMRSLRVQKKAPEKFINEEELLRRTNAAEETEIELMDLEALFVEVYEQAESKALD
ncbi:hypothetical protein BGZ60DRAFT_527732 [Tricladium varicosporioides]|nr:hypothetical protein BGZ60DRAFT_527732 [Hymenoscyphus varicosporioides]